MTVLWVLKEGAEPYGASAEAFFSEIGVAADIVELRRDHRSVGAQSWPRRRGAAAIAC